MESPVIQEAIKANSLMQRKGIQCCFGQVRDHLYFKSGNKIVESCNWEIKDKFVFPYDIGP